ncbi:hypothetical protein [Microbacterium sp. ZW T5_56]|uniref:hypothetical protein n=1 Tax=Microbacterium sp. ZW T5_56 TaxID=3378081 RepID=UPI0038538D8C
MPESEFFDYETVREGDVTTVTATLKDSLENVALAAGAQTSWTFDMSFVPILEAPADWSFSYDATTDVGTGYIFDSAVADFLTSHAISMTLTTEAIEAYDYGVFDAFGNQLTEFGTYGVATNTTSMFDVEQSGQALAFTRVSTQVFGGQPSAEQLFAAQGPLPEGATVQAIPETWRWIAYWGSIEALYDNGCSLSTTIGTGSMLG